MLLKSTPTHQVMALDDLPVEILAMIMKFLDVKDIYALMQLGPILFRTAVPLVWRSIRILDFVKIVPFLKQQKKFSAYRPLLDLIDQMEVYSKRTFSLAENLWRISLNTDKPESSARGLKRTLSSVLNEQEENLMPKKILKVETKAEEEENIDTSLTIDATKNAIIKMPMADYSYFVRHIELRDEEETQKPSYVPNQILWRLFSLLERLETCRMSACCSFDDSCLLILGTFSFQHLSSVDFSYCRGITNQGIVHLVQQCLKLKEISLANTEITDVSLNSIATFSKDLRKLNVSKCQVTNYGVKNICFENKKLIELHLGFCPLISANVVHSIVLRVDIQILSLQGLDSFLDSDFNHLLNHCHQLRELNLDGCSLLSDDSLQTIGILSELKKLNLCRVAEITNETLKFLVSKCLKLEEIYLAKCRLLTNETIIFLSKTLPNLKSIFLTGISNITDEAIDHLTRNCSRLTILSLPGCSITDLSVRYAIRLSETLAVAHFSFCDHIYPAAVVELCHFCPHLKIVHLVNCRNIRNSFLKFFSREKPVYLTHRSDENYVSLRQPEISKIGNDFYHA